MALAEIGDDRASGGGSGTTDGKEDVISVCPQSHVFQVIPIPAANRRRNPAATTSLALTVMARIPTAAPMPRDPAATRESAARRLVPSERRSFARRALRAASP